MTVTAKSQARPDAGVAPFLDQFGAARAWLPGMEHAFVTDFRQRCLGRFESLGLPTTKLEAWHFTNVAPVLRQSFEAVEGPVEATGIDSVAPLVETSGHRLVFVGGRYQPHLSDPGDLPRGVVLEPLPSVLAKRPELVGERLGDLGYLDDNAFDAINGAMMSDGAVLVIDDGVSIEAPIEIVFLAGLGDEARAEYVRSLLVLGTGAKATVIERHGGFGDEARLRSAGVEAFLGPQSALRHHKVQEEGAATVHVAGLQARLDRDAVLESFTLHRGARLARQDTVACLEGEGAQCRLNGAYLLRGEQHCDNTTRIEHRVPHTACSEVFKGVVDDRARGVFQGTIVVHRDAQGTDGHQSSRALLLSDQATVDTKPELEIYADDVKCSHGATIGELDSEAMFYLRSRGLDEASARRLLIGAFIEDALAEISDEAVRQALGHRAIGWLEAEEMRP